jgi:hypothetical protein
MIRGVTAALEIYHHWSYRQQAGRFSNACLRIINTSCDLY